VMPPEARIADVRLVDTAAPCRPPRAVFHLMTVTEADSCKTSLLNAPSTFSSRGDLNVEVAGAFDPGTVPTNELL
jgi:hypothetical protein